MTGDSPEWGMLGMVSPCETERQEIKVCATHRGGEGGKELIESRGKGGNLLILSFLRPFSRSKRHRPGVSAGFTSPVSVCDFGALTKRDAQQNVAARLLSGKTVGSCRTPPPLPLKCAHCLNLGIPGIPRH